MPTDIRHREQSCGEASDVKGPPVRNPVCEAWHDGTTAKTVLAEGGPVRIEIPRDGEGSCKLMLVHKRERRLTAFDEKIVAMY